MYMRFLGQGIGHQDHTAAGSDSDTIIVNDMYCDSDLEDASDIDDDDHRNGAGEDLDDTEDEDEDEGGDESFDEDSDLDDMGYDDL
jgi:hypothetical protein